MTAAARLHVRTVRSDLVAARHGGYHAIPCECRNPKCAECHAPLKNGRKRRGYRRQP